jgi:hypothetical protein
MKWLFYCFPKIIINAYKHTAIDATKNFLTPSSTETIIIPKIQPTIKESQTNNKLYILVLSKT